MSFKFKAFVLVWVLCFVVTYGHAYHYQKPYTVMFSGERRESDNIEKGFLALMASALWPLYWSQHLWSQE